MAASTISRATWTDDDGTGTTGTIINNARLGSDIYDKVDAMFAGSGSYTTFEFGGGVKTDGLLNVAGGLQLTNQTKSGTYTVVGTDHTIFANGTFTVTLPTAAGRTGQQFCIKNIGTGTVTVGTTSSQTIDGSTTFSLTVQYQSITVESDGSNWFIV